MHATLASLLHCSPVHTRDTLLTSAQICQCLGTVDLLRMMQARAAACMAMSTSHGFPHTFKNWPVTVDMQVPRKVAVRRRNALGVPRGRKASAQPEALLYMTYRVELFPEYSSLIKVPVHRTIRITPC